MQLDHTRVTIRERSILEICDLALHVVRDFMPRLLTMWLVGVLPMAILNYFLIGRLVEDLTGPSFARYAWIMSLLVFIETPLATAAMTMFLGDAMFMEPPTLRTILKSITTLSGKLFLTQGLLRGVIPAWLLALSLSSESAGWGDAFFVLLIIYLIFMRALRPYVMEIVLLERNPLWARDQRAITIGRRSSKLHNPNAGELFARYLGIILVSALLAVMVLFGIWFAIGMLQNDWRWGPLMLHVVYPASLWTVAGYMAVVRYLAYLDLRTRREGWAVELQMRAEANRLAKQMAI